MLYAPHYLEKEDSVWKKIRPEIVMMPPSERLFGKPSTKEKQCVHKPER